jgi:lactoylglutathione lyase
VAELASLVLFSDHLAENIAFYRALGVPLEDEDHGDGVTHAAGELGDVHVAVLASERAGAEQGWRQGGTTFVGLWVPSLEDAGAAVAALGAPLLREHEQCEWGCRIVVADPDGRAVEVNQEGHCP